MASGTVEKVVQQLDNSREVVRLSLDNADTYVTRKLTTIDTVNVSLNAGNSGSVAATWSGRTVTVYHSESRPDVSLIIYGE